MQFFLRGQLLSRQLFYDSYFKLSGITKIIPTCVFRKCPDADKIDLGS